MDEASVRQHAEAHAAAAMRSDFDAMAGDVAGELQPQLPQLAQLLPQPVQQADVLSVNAKGEEAVVQIRFAGPGKQVTLETQWKERDGRPKIVTATPVT